MASAVPLTSPPMTLSARPSCRALSFGTISSIKKKEREGSRKGFEPIGIERERPGGSTRTRSPEVSFMTIVSSVTADCPAARSITSGSTAILQAARLLLPNLERGQSIDAGVLRAAMETAFGVSNSVGAWNWKTAYDACEAATVLFLRKYGKAIFRKADTPASRLPH